jgi:hypothetical protein
VLAHPICRVGGLSFIRRVTKHMVGVISCLGYYWGYCYCSLTMIASLSSFFFFFLSLYWYFSAVMVTGFMHVMLYRCDSCNRVGGDVWVLGSVV